MSESLVLLGIIIAASSGLPGLLCGRTLDGRTVGDHAARRARGGAWPGGRRLVLGHGRQSDRSCLPWSLPGAEFRVGMDGLSAIFLVPIFLISLLGNVYGLGYWKQTEHPENGRKLRLFYGTLTAGMALLVIARNSILFLFGWEIMALSAFFLVATEDDEKEVREAGWLYLVATHAATLCLFALFALLHAVHGSFTLGSARPGTPAAGHGDRDLRPCPGGFRLQSRHHAAARLASRRPCGRRRAMSRRSCRVSSSRWAFTGCSG